MHFEMFGASVLVGLMSGWLAGIAMKAEDTGKLCLLLVQRILDLFRANRRRKRRRDSNTESKPGREGVERGV
jgi:hypothetical protein